MNTFKPYPGDRDINDPAIQRLASLTELPSQPVNMNPGISIVGTQIQQIKANAAVPVVSSAAPVTVTRRNLGGGQFQFRVQFIAPTPAQDPNYQGTTVLISTPNGTDRLAASSGAGPIVFNSSQTTAPGKVVIQQNNFNATSDTGLGNGLSKALIQT